MAILKSLAKRVYQKIKTLISENNKHPTVFEKFGSNLVVHPSSIIKENSSIHFSPQYDPLSIKKVFIGTRCLITANFFFETDTGVVKIGNNVYIGGASFFCKSGINIGDNVTMAWGIVLYDHDAHSTDWMERSKDNERCYNDYLKYNGNLNVTKDWTVVKSKEIIIADNVWIGFDTLILKGVKIGKGAVIAAKSVVTKDVPAWTLVAGNPAKVVKHLTSYD